MSTPKPTQEELRERLEGMNALELNEELRRERNKKLRELAKILVDSGRKVVSSRLSTGEGDMVLLCAPHALKDNQTSNYLIINSDLLEGESEGFLVSPELFFQVEAERHRQSHRLDQPDKGERQ